MRVHFVISGKENITSDRKSQNARASSYLFSKSYGPCGPARAFIIKLLENPRIRAFRIRTKRAGKSRMVLLGTRMPCAMMRF